MRRRKFLNTAALLAGGALLSNKLFASSVLKESIDHFQLQGSKVVIVGAGVSGLYAAQKLKAAGADVTVLEASGIHGGRVRALSDFGNFPIELGAENVHGKGNQNGNPPSFLYKDIYNYNPSLLTDITNEPAIYALDNSWVWDSYTDADILKFYTFYYNAYLYNGGEQTVADYMYELYGIDENHRTWHFYEAYIGAEYGTSVKRMSMKGYGREENLWLTGTHDYALNDSYLNILDTLYFNSVLDNVLYNRQVTAIDYNTSSVTVTDNTGTQFACDAVLVTVPLTVLKNGVINFSPALPASKLTAIDKIGMDKGMKIIMKFNDSWWNNNMYYLLLKSYTTECWAPGKVIDGATNNILTAFIMGEHADYMSALGNDAVSVALAELDGLFNGAASASFTDAHIQDWSKEQFIGGAYSYPVAGTFTSNGKSKRVTLAKTVKNRLFFAGEATNNHHSATVHGALESGSAAADAIISKLGLRLNVTGVAAAEDLIFCYGNILNIEIDLEEAGNVQSDLYNINGQKVKSLLNKNYPEGEVDEQFDLHGFPAGIYVVQLRKGQKVWSRKIVIQ